MEQYPTRIEKMDIKHLQHIEEKFDELDKCSCGRYKNKQDACCWICEEDAMDIEEDR